MLLIKNKIRFKLVYLFFFIASSFLKLQAQNFVNPDLNGIITGSSNLPTGWQNVPKSDPVCLATNFNFGDTPDLTDLTMPHAPAGIIGNPYSGTTFVSGARSLTGNEIFDEGIMQGVTSFVIGNSYKINFQQAVVKQLGSEDNSGAWRVYVDSTLIGITNPTYSADSIRSTSFKWESRDVYFTATDTMHTIKFLPYDDDTNIVYSVGDTTGALRMGIDSINLTPCLNFNLGNDTLICSTDTITLNVATPGATYIWQDNSTDSTFNVTQDGIYWVTVTTTACSITDTIVIGNANLPIVNLGNDTTLCEGENLFLNASSLNATYIWQDNSIDSIFNINQAGTYFVGVTNICGTVSDTINVIVDTLNINLGVDTILCLGDTVMLDASSINVTYNWQNFNSDSTFLVTQAGNYWCEIKRGNCLKSDTINIVYDSIPEINLGNDTTLCEDESLLLNASTLNSTYIWQDNSTNTTFLVESPNIYWLQVMNSCATNSDTIEVTFTACNSTIEMPNVFTPNGDRQNDLFLPIQSFGVISYQLTIYNRWGQKVFNSEQLMLGWDGRTTAGDKVPNGTYFWVINYSDQENPESSLKGTVTLLRD